MRTTWRGSTLAILGALAVAGTATAQIPVTAKCESGKEKCALGYTTGLLGCHSKDEAKPDPVKFVPCLDKAKVKFDGGLDPTKGCFEKLEAKPPCLTNDDTGSIDSRVNAFVIDAVTTLDPSYPPSTLSKCGSGKKKCVTNLVKALLGCYAANSAKPDPIKLGPCLDKAKTKFDGGIDPAKGCFEKLESKMPNDCQTFDDTGAVFSKTETFVESTVAALSCGNGRVDAGETCDDGNQVCGDGCSDICRTEVCGDGVQNCGESCDDGNLINSDACPSDCIIDACTPNSGSSQLVTVNFASSASVAGILVLVDYPEGKISIPGSGPVDGRISGLPASVNAASNDLDHALREFVSKSVPFTSIPAGQLFRVNFETCASAPAPVAGDFTCTVLSASDPFGALVTGVTTCSVTVP